MNTAIANEEMLRSAGYRYSFYFMAYVNRKDKKLFSVEALEGHSEDWIRERMEQPNESGEWMFFYTNDEQPSPAVAEAIAAQLG